jgi:hypothetical protein
MVLASGNGYGMLAMMFEVGGPVQARDRQDRRRG